MVRLSSAARCAGLAASPETVSSTPARRTSRPSCRRSVRASTIAPTRPSSMRSAMQGISRAVSGVAPKPIKPRPINAARAACSDESIDVIQIASGLANDAAHSMTSAPRRPLCALLLVQERSHAKSAAGLCAAQFLLPRNRKSRHCCRQSSKRRKPWPTSYLQDLKDGLLTITMNRPERKNAMSPEFTLALVACGAAGGGRS